MNAFCVNLLWEICIMIMREIRECVLSLGQSAEGVVVEVNAASQVKDCSSSTSSSSGGAAAATFAEAVRHAPIFRSLESLSMDLLYYRHLHTNTLRER